MARMFRTMSVVPPEYEGGIGQEGVDALKAFVEKGGTLVTLNGASDFAINEFGPPARNALQGVERTKFFCPTSILKILVDNETDFARYYIKKLSLFKEFWFYLEVKTTVDVKVRRKSRELFHADVLFAGLY